MTGATSFIKRSSPVRRVILQTLPTLHAFIGSFFCCNNPFPCSFSYHHHLQHKQLCAVGLPDSVFIAGCPHNKKRCTVFCVSCRGQKIWDCKPMTSWSFKMHPILLERVTDYAAMVAVFSPPLAKTHPSVSGLSQSVRKRINPPGGKVESFCLHSLLFMVVEWFSLFLILTIDLFIIVTFSCKIKLLVPLSGVWRNLGNPLKALQMWNVELFATFGPARYLPLWLWKTWFFPPVRPLNQPFHKYLIPLRMP